MNQQLLPRFSNLFPFAAGSAIFLAASIAAWAQSVPEVVFILDGSGSMAGRAGGKSKMEAAKEVMREVVPGLPADVRLGLVAYGHRRKGDCTDIEVLIPPGSTDRDGLVQRVMAIQPMGKTPLSDAVATTAELLKTRDAETTIVLVSDGIETCAADPCPIVKQLKSTGIPFIMHVVGFGVDAKAQEQLDCMAGAAGGKYFPVADKDALLAALMTVREEISQKVEKAKSVHKEAATGLPKLIIRLPASSTVSVGGLRILKADGKPIKETKELPAESSHPLPPGAYDVETLFHTPNYGEPAIARIGQVELAAGQTKRLDLGAVAFNVAPELEKSWIDSVILADAGSGKEVVTVLSNNNGYYNFKPKPVTPGVYDLLVRFSNSPAPSCLARNITVAPGKETVVKLDSGLQFKEAPAAGLAGWDLVPLDSDQRAAPDEDGGAAKTGPLPLIQARPPSGNKSTLWMTYLAPPGKYRLLAHIEGMSEPLPVAPELEIKEGEVLHFDSGL